MSELIHRRGLLVGLGALFAAPAIVRASSLMPVKPWSRTAIVDLRELEQIKARILIQWDKIARNDLAA